MFAYDLPLSQLYERVLCASARTLRHPRQLPHNAQTCVCCHRWTVCTAQLVRYTHLSIAHILMLAPAHMGK